MIEQPTPSTLEKEKTQLSKGTIKVGMILGGVAGFVGGYYKATLTMNGHTQFGILMLVLFLPLVAPVSGLIPAYLLRKVVKEKWAFIFLSIVSGFLAGYLPFNYWLAY
jgi:hypothetical protein